MTVHLLRAADDESVDTLARFLRERARAEWGSEPASRDERDSAVRAVCDGKDPESIELWRWLASQAPRHDLFVSAFMSAIDAAAQHRLARASVQGFKKGEFDAFPSRCIRVLGTRRQAGAQTDFLRLFGATLIDMGVRVDAAGLQTQAKRVAHLVLGAAADGLAPNTVSKVWAELRADAKAFPPRTSLLAV